MANLPTCRALIVYREDMRTIPADEPILVGVTQKLVVPSLPYSSTGLRAMMVIGPPHDITERGIRVFDPDDKMIWEHRRLGRVLGPDDDLYVHVGLGGVELTKEGRHWIKLVVGENGEHVLGMWPLQVKVASLQSGRLRIPPG